jgi:hypothetical protein
MKKNDPAIPDSPTKRAVLAVVGPAAVWAVSRFLDRPKMQRKRKRVDAEVLIKGHDAVKAIKKRSKNTVKNPGYLAAGISTLAVAIGLLARASKK